MMRSSSQRSFARVSVGPIVLCAALFLCSSVAASSAWAEANVGDRAPAIKGARDARGKRTSLKSYRGKVVVVTFGASWCKPCKKELPAWEKLAASYRDRGVVFLAVNIDKDAAKGKKFMGKAKLRAMRALYDSSGATAELYSPPTMPTTYVIGPRGIIRYRHAGYRAGDEKELAKKLDQLLKK
ncbi:MAG: hypothetical protein Tsb0020_29840 [Haliangiales bacterium]